MTPPLTATTSAATSPFTSADSSQQLKQGFIWGVGIECSFLPHIDVDQFDWTQHNRFWKDDFKLIKDTLGVSHLRYALPWHKLETEPGTFDWSLADERIGYAKELGIELMMDVMHFGTPKWLPQAVGDPRFPEALERFTEQFVDRYKNDIQIWCPFNEPLVSALFSGDFGFWPPFARKWRGYMPVMSRIVQAVNRSIAAIRRVHPGATVLLADALENFQSKNPELQHEVALRNQRRFLVLDLLSGRVDHHHPLYTWLTAFGFSELDLDHLKNNPQMPDWIGLDYYPHSDWQIEKGTDDKVRQRRADAPLGVYGLAKAMYDRYGLPMVVSETSIDGPPISREIWINQMTDQIKQLREEGVPMAGFIWWPMFDQIDWDGALRHRIGKIHKVGLFQLNRTADGTLKRAATPLAKYFRQTAESGEEAIGALGEWAVPLQQDDPQLPPLLVEARDWNQIVNGHGHTNGNGNGHANGNGNGKVTIAASTVAKRISADSPAPGLGGEPQVAEKIEIGAAPGTTGDKYTDKYGIVVFSHLRWGFVWQRPQQFLSRFARYQPVLFCEEPFFDLAAGKEPRLDIHRVLPNVVVACPHCPPEMAKDAKLPERLRNWVREAMESVNQRGEFDQPLLWYYSPMDSAWSLGHFPNRGIVYDCMDELSQFTGAPKELVDNERRLMDHADIVFTGGYELWTKKNAIHPNAHFYGCGVEFDHFNLAQNEDTTIPADIDFVPRPIIGWFGVVDERVDYHLLAEVARMRPEWSFCMVGPVVKVDPNLLPHSPNLHWLGGRDYQVLPNYCKAFDVNMMCFAINKATEFINPTKALEYLATGKPVVSTPVKDVVRQYPDYLEIAKTPEEFVAAIGKCLLVPDKDKIAKGLELAKSKSWESTVAAMRQNIKDAINVDDRRSTKAKPGPDPEPGYFFKHTPGS